MAAYNANDTSILLESGTNELELLEFNICGNSYGINIAKVREIMMEQELVPMPQAPDEIEGVFMPRDKLITVIDLHKVLGTEKPADARGLFCGLWPVRIGIYRFRPCPPRFFHFLSGY